MHLIVELGEIDSNLILVEFFHPTNRHVNIDEGLKSIPLTLKSARKPEIIRCIVLDSRDISDSSLIY